ncbi:hypothetical protein ASPWEDRAFT_44856 [Aspergillus wentii DTO 134E9]|uniref:Peptidase C14 caspase domain-containing protein n=1 Tax=Aspergillus wentii DTO 134E9 TaxID=1073089 RepID=A0A1L9R7H7_ASPWE|nr:uncharacterized protein ASPWEDRAFT_44856 [Aspergillus wentii DTO 134E9]KAI9927509.1 hypothetical protein MW887_003126 [Aspergillus wentii]OJJ30885.1 hypothetical protein ASPWEDRAFT_44856 [Aspergillus wentii DTO 134E9]
MSTKRALMIAAPFEGLRGPIRDAERMEAVLRKQDFEITTCYGADATRSGILNAWQNLISTISTGDAVVIYYSGHGGLVQSKDGESSSGKPWQYQFLVPVDYDQTTDDDFRGILDVEISHMLQDTTDKTRNVTIILDCCHSGRMFRAPGMGQKAHAKNLEETQYHQVAKYLTTLREAGHFHGEVSLTGNPYAVRVVAAATSETAWEYMDSNGQWGGAYTEALARAIEETAGHELSWRTTLMRVSQLVNVKFPTQHPQAEGPETRIPFSMQHAMAGAFHLRVVNNAAILEAGSVLGVRKGNVYSIVPLDSDDHGEGDEFPEATVTVVAAFKAKVKLTFMPSWENLQHLGALAFLKRETVEKQPVSVTSENESLLEGVDSSRYLQRRGEEDTRDAILDFRQEEQSVILSNAKGIEVGSCPMEGAEVSQAFDDLLLTAERYVRAQRVLDLRCARIEDRLDHLLNVEIGIVEDGEVSRKFEDGGPNHIDQKDKIYIQLLNNGNTTIYISIFDVNVAGRISLITEPYPLGMELPPSRSVTLGSDEFGDLVGLQVSWPDEVPKKVPIEENYVFVITSSPVDLRHLTDSESLNVRLVRDTAVATNSVNIRYDILHVPFDIRPVEEEPQPAEEERQIELPDMEHTEDKECPADGLPDCDCLPECESLPEFPPMDMPKGIIGGIIRATKNIPPCIWVVNKHTEPITVVVSKYRPNRMLTGIGLNGSATGAGVNFNSSTWVGPATKKSLPPVGSTGKSMAVFPLWTRREGFGVISVFKGEEQKLFIENDQVPLGATAYFENNPDLDIVHFAGGKQNNGMF